MLADTTPPARRKPLARSKVSNGTALLAGVDGRSTWVRRCRDLIAAHVADLGGPDACSEAERRAATLTVELERLEKRFALAGEAEVDDLDLYQRTAGNLRRLLEAIGLQRRSRDITPTLDQYLAARAMESDADASEEASWPSLIRRRTVDGLTERAAAASSIVTSPRSRRSPSR